MSEPGPNDKRIDRVEELARRLAQMAEAAMPFIRAEGFVQFGPNCAIHVDKIASTSSAIIRKAFFAWMKSVRQYHTAVREAGLLKEGGE